MKTVLITGGSGFLALHIIKQALEKSYSVRTTIRNTKRESDILESLKNTPGIENLSFYEADLMKDEGWDNAAQGCDYVIHTASPFPMSEPNHEDELIIPARDGTLRVLTAANRAKVKRAIITSSFAAIGYGHVSNELVFDENYWTNINGPNVSAYVKSKAIAEKAAWDFVANCDSKMELSVINPVAIFGPVLNNDFGTSVEVVEMMMNGKMPGLANVHLGIVDVRDVAELHLLAMTHVKAKGQRYLATAGEGLFFADIAKILRDGFGEKAAKVPTFVVPNFLLRILALFMANARDAVPHLSIARKGTSAKAIKELGWKPKSEKEAILSCAQSLIDFGIIK